MSELQERIVAHHVGARGFGVALNCPPKLRKHLIHVVYEADAQCAKEMITQNKDENFHILPYCLGQRQGRARLFAGKIRRYFRGRRQEAAKLFICKNPYFSSNIEPNPDYGRYYCEVHLDGPENGVELKGECYDLDYSDDMGIVRVADVAVRTRSTTSSTAAMRRRAVIRISCRSTPKAPSLPFSRAARGHFANTAWRWRRRSSSTSSTRINRCSPTSSNSSIATASTLPALPLYGSFPPIGCRSGRATRASSASATPCFCAASKACATWRSPRMNASARCSTGPSAPWISAISN